MFTPKEIATNYIVTAKAKTTAKWYKTLVLAVLAGAFIAFGGAASSAAAAGLTGSAAAAVKAAVFPVGLILVVVCGAELFTGNCLLVAPMIERRVSVPSVLKNWGIVYGGNLIGGVVIGVLVAVCGVQSDAWAASTVATAVAKSNMNFGAAFARGILCNMLVCLAVWASMSTKSTAGKALAVYLPVFAFVVCGFEHSVANMYYLTAGLVTDAIVGGGAVSLGNALLYCLLPSTLGNIVGGGLIAIAYSAAYGSRLKKGAEAESDIPAESVSMPNDADKPTEE